ncbi:hypothetical protein BDZ45DRAFT_681911 [Acephala macrosclerotiorum]|nr:hypothetical protein BDZ45DRAFT_681911 [Acephala macrosclerotiorum]
MATLVPAPKVAFILQVKVTFDPKDRDTFIKYFKPCYDSVIVEPECAYFLIGEDLQQPGVYRWTEGWTKDAAWFMNEQITKPYYKPYLKATEPLFTSERVAEAYAPLGGMGHIKIDFSTVEKN